MGYDAFLSQCPKELMRDPDHIHLLHERHVAARALPLPSLEEGAVSFQTYHNDLRRLIQQILHCVSLCFWNLEVSSPSCGLLFSGHYPTPVAISRGFPALYFCFLQCGLSTNSAWQSWSGLEFSLLPHVRFILQYRGLALFTTASFSAKDCKGKMR